MWGVPSGEHSALQLLRFTCNFVNLDNLQFVSVSKTEFCAWESWGESVYLYGIVIQCSLIPMLSPLRMAGRAWE